MTTISVRLEDSEKELLKEYADKNDLSMSQVIRKAIKELLAQDNQQ